MAKRLWLVAWPFSRCASPNWGSTKKNFKNSNFFSKSIDLVFLLLPEKEIEMKNLFVFILICAAAVFAIGCGDDGGNPVAAEAEQDLPEMSLQEMVSGLLLHAQEKETAAAPARRLDWSLFSRVVLTLEGGLVVDIQRQGDTPVIIAYHWQEVFPNFSFIQFTKVRIQRIWMQFYNSNLRRVETFIDVAFNPPAAFGPARVYF